MGNAQPTIVSSTFDLLLEELEREFDLLNTAGSQAFAAGDHAQAQEMINRAKKLTELRSKVATLRTEWETTFPQKAQPQRSPSLPAGQRTPEADFYRPILQALSESGGSGSIGTVLNRVHDLMHDKLNNFDHQPLNSDKNLPRWRNTAQWARDSMVKAGLLKNTSPRGTWEISEAGREQLKTG